MLIYVSFKPLDIKQQTFNDVPIFELKQFTMYELDTKGLKTFMTGDSATRYENRYTVKDIDYTDNSKQMISNMKALDGVYKDEKITLSGDVVYTREDGLTFESQKVFYDKKSSIVTSNKGFTAYLDKNKIRGTYLRYNSITQKIYSKNIDAIYQIKD